MDSGNKCASDFEVSVLNGLKGTGILPFLTDISASALDFPARYMPARIAGQPSSYISTRFRLVKFDTMDLAARPRYTTLAFCMPLALDLRQAL